MEDREWRAEQKGLHHGQWQEEKEEEDRGGGGGACGHASKGKETRLQCATQKTPPGHEATATNLWGWMRACMGSRGGQCGRCVADIGVYNHVVCVTISDASPTLQLEPPPPLPSFFFPHKHTFFSAVVSL